MLSLSLLPLVLLPQSVTCFSTSRAPTALTVRAAHSYDGGALPRLRTREPAAARARMIVPLSPPIPQLEHLSLLRPALAPIVSVIGLCVLGMVPSGLKALVSQSGRQKLHRRVFTGCSLGVVVSLWIFSGTYAFLSIFALFAIVAQNEYYYMARENGCYPTWKLGLLGSVGMYVAACSANPVLRDALFPLTGTVTIVYLVRPSPYCGLPRPCPDPYATH